MFNLKNEHILSILIIVFISVGNFNFIFSQNLILNPGCEDTLINGEIPYWVEVVGANWTQRGGTNPPPYEGAYMFFPGVALTAELQQDVDVSNMAQSIDSNIIVFNFEGYVRAYSQSPPDQSRIMLEYLDSLKTTKLDSFDSGNYSNTSEWVQITDTTLTPVGTRFIRIRLISTRHAGSNNDGYYDGLSLQSIITGRLDEPNNKIPDDIYLAQNYPNPFNPSTTIEFSITKTEFVNLKIYNLLGQELSTLVSNKLSPDNYKYIWNASEFSGGVYFYKLEADHYAKIKKMIFLK